jgi:hypothetical protein
MGNMTSDLSQMVQLTYLFLANNSFVAGPIPSSFASLSNLEELCLQKTNREGLLPVFIADFVNLTLLDFEDNQLTGALPSEYSQLKNLEFFLVNRNLGVAGETAPSRWQRHCCIRQQSFCFLTKIRTFCVLFSRSDSRGIRELNESPSGLS